MLAILDKMLALTFSDRGVVSDGDAFKSKLYNISDQVIVLYEGGVFNLEFVI